MPDDRYALSFESEPAGLGGISLRLLRLGIDALFASSADEALLLAGDAGELIHAVIVPPRVAITDLHRVVQRINSAHDRKPPPVVVIGEKPPEEVLASLRSAGAEWAVWDATDDSTLRFAVNAAMTLPSEIVPRQEPRIPTNMMASFWAGGSRGDAVAYTLSAKGAFLETPRPSPVGTLLKIEIWLPTICIRTAARVIYVNEPGDRRRASWPIGMGVVFDGRSEEQESKVRRFIVERAESMLI